MEPSFCMSISNLQEIYTSGTSSCFSIYKKCLINADQTDFYCCIKGILIDEFTFPNTTKIISGRSFLWSSVRSVVIPDSVVTIGKDCFWQTYSLKKLVLPLNWNYDSTVLSYCDSIRELVVRMRVVPDLKLKYPTVVTLIIGEKTEVIAENAFISVNLLSNIIIPPSVTSIGNYAFSGLSRLHTVSIYGSPTIGENVFRGTFVKCITCYPSLHDSLIESGIRETAFNGCMQTCNYRSPVFNWNSMIYMAIVIM